MNAHSGKGRRLRRGPKDLPMLWGATTWRPPQRTFFADSHANGSAFVPRKATMSRLKAIRNRLSVCAYGFDWSELERDLRYEHEIAVSPHLSALQPPSI